MDHTPRTRRSLLRRVGLAAGGVALGSATASGTTAATDDANTGSGHAGPRVQQADDGARVAKVYASDFYRGARFRVASGDLPYKPQFEVQEGESFLVPLYWSGYETRVIRYAGTGERVLWFPPVTARVSRGDEYRMGAIVSVEELAPNVVAASFEPVT